MSEAAIKIAETSDQSSMESRNKLQVPDILISAPISAKDTNRGGSFRPASSGSRAISNASSTRKKKNIIKKFSSINVTHMG